MELKNYVSLLAVSSLSLTVSAQEKPNIIWLMAEDIALDLECYGEEGVKTPNLNRLAEEGLLFNHCYCTNPISSPNRSSMMTGIHQLKINAEHHRSNRNISLPENVKPFTWYLRNNGYTTILGNEIVMDKGRKTDCNFRHTATGPYDGINNFGLFDKLDTISSDDQPFFAQIQLKVTHRGDWWDSIRSISKHPVNPEAVNLPPYLADHPVIRMDWAKYLDQIEYMDDEIGFLIEDLKRKDLYNNTIIIFIGDNGRSNIRGKGYLNDPGLHVPLIISGPGIKDIPVNINKLVSTVDITATILEMAGLEIPEQMDGISIFNNDFEREYVYSARDTWDEILDKSRSITTIKYKYIYHYIPYIPFDAQQAYPEFYRPALHIMRKLKYKNLLENSEMLFFQPYKPEEELYNLENDPFELNNLANKSEYMEVQEKMRITIFKEEEMNQPEEKIYVPVIPVSVEVLKFVMYNYPEEYIGMLNGKEIGFQKYSELYRKYLKSK